MNSVTAAVGHIAAHGDVHRESAQTLVRRTPKPAELLVHSSKKAKNQETCQQWSETHADAHEAHQNGGTHHAHNQHTSHNDGCPEGQTRNLDADNAAIGDEDGNGVTDE